MGKVIGVGTVAPSLRVRGRGDFSRVTLLLRHGNFLSSYWKLHTAAETRRKKRWPCWARRSTKQPVIYRSPCFASRARTRHHRLHILLVRARAINIPRRHMHKPPSTDGLMSLVYLANARAWKLATPRVLAVTRGTLSSRSNTG